LQCVAVCCSVLQWIAKKRKNYCPRGPRESLWSVLQCNAVCCSGVLQCVAVCCSVLQCVAVVCCSGVLQCVAASCTHSKTKTYLCRHGPREKLWAESTVGLDRLYSSAAASRAPVFFFCERFFVLNVWFRCLKLSFLFWTNQPQLLGPLCVAVCCSVLQCVAMCCSALQCVAVCLYLLHTAKFQLHLGTPLPGRVFFLFPSNFQVWGGYD